MRNISLKLAVAACSVGVVSASIAVPKKANAIELEEVVVTARKIEERLQDVPLSIEAFTAADIDALGLNSLDRLIRNTSGIQLTGGFSPQDTRIVLRGLSPTRGRPNVGVLQDGIDVSSEAIGTAGSSLLVNPRLFDLERVEVVKGPQSALYGRSSFAGAINYVTRRPSDTNQGAIGFDVGDNGQRELKASYSGPVTDSLAVGVSAVGWGHDGFYQNEVTGGDAGDTEGVAFSFVADWTPTENFNLYVRAETTDDEFGPQAQAVLGADSLDLPAQPDAVAAGVISPAVAAFGIPAVVGVLPGADGLSVLAGDNPRTPGEDYDGIDRKVTRFSAIADWELGNFTITSLSHYADANIEAFHDLRKVGSSFVLPINLGELNYDTSTELFSQDLRLAFNNNGPVSWVLGALIWQEDVEQLDSSINCLVLFPPTTCGPFLAQYGTTLPFDPSVWTRETDHFSIYGQLSWQLSDSVEASIETRYADEENIASGPIATRAFFAPIPGAVPFQDLGNNTGSISDDYFASRATLEWSVADDSKLYASYSNGVKPAGISTVTGGVVGFNPDGLKFEAEKINVFELGSKTSISRSLDINVAAFYQDFTDKQTSTLVVLNEELGLTGIVPVNASSAHILGLEFGVDWQATEKLFLNLSYTYLESEYDDFKKISTSPVEITEAGNCVPLDLTAIPGADACEIDFSGNELPDVPQHSLVLGANYVAPLSDTINFVTGFNYRYETERYLMDSNLRQYDKLSILDLRLGLANKAWDLTFYVNNALDDDTITAGTTFIDSFKSGFVGGPPGVGTFVAPNAVMATLPNKRQLGLRFNYRFGS